MIPIAVSSKEAQYIRQLLCIQDKGNRKKQQNQDDHPRHPRKTNKNEVSPVNKIDITKEYQIVYKDQTGKKSTTTEKVVIEEKDSITDDNVGSKITVKPRGPPQGFFNREKFQQILTSNLRTDKDQNQGENWGLRTIILFSRPVSKN